METFDFFYEVVDTTLLTLFHVFRVTWWVLVPAFLASQIKGEWKNWLQSKTAAKFEYVLLEILPPPDVLKTPKAMENVLIGLAGGWKEHNWRDKYWRGEIQDTFSLELVGNNGSLRFFVRCLRNQKSWVESKFYAQYPDAEIHEVEDYINSLPEQVPNPNWDVWGAAYTLVQGKGDDWTLPIRTYLDWEDMEEERRISPFSQLGETVATLGENEWVMFQLLISPVITEYKGAAERKRDQIMKRDAGHAPSVGIFTQIFDFFRNMDNALLGRDLTWSEPGHTEEKQNWGALMMTHDEMEMVKAIAMKASKTHFVTMIHGMYLYRRDEAHKERISDMNGWIRQFSSESLNGLRPTSGTYPSSNPYLFNKTKNRRRMQRLFFAYKTRWIDYIRDPYPLNVEEIATIFHLPGKIAQTPALSRVISKATQPPTGLPRFSK